MGRKTTIIVGIMIAMPLLLLGSLRHSRSVRSQSVASVDADSPRRSAPDFELISLDGRRVKLSDFRGKVVALNFWATYCAPCRVEMPWLIEFYRKYKEQGLEVIGVSMDDGGTQPVADFVKEMNVNYLVLMGNHAVGDAYGGMRFLPQTVFVGRDGKIIKHTVGIKTKSDFEDVIRESRGTQTP